MLWGQLGDILQPMFTSAESFSSALVPLGWSILSLSLLLTVGNEVLQFWVGGGAQKLLGKLLRVAIVTSIPFAALASWGTWGPMNGKLVNFFTSEVSGAITGSASGGAFSAIESTVNAMFAAFPTFSPDGSTTTSAPATASATPASPYPSTAVNCTNAIGGATGVGASYVSASGTCPSGFISTPYVPPSATTYPSGAMGVATGAPTGTASEGSGWMYAITHLGETMTKLIAITLLAIPTLILAVALIFSLYGPLLMLLIGVVFGPVLIAWLPFEPLSNLSTTWLRYMVSMGIAFAVGILLATIGTAALKTFTAALASMDASLLSFGAFIGGILATTAGMLFLAYMMFKVEHIAAGMVGGPSIGGGSGFLAFAAGRMGRMTSPKQKPSSDKAGADGAKQGSAGDSGGAGAGSPGGVPGAGVAPGTGQQSTLSAQAGNTAQAAGASSAGAGERLKSAAVRAVRSDVAKAAVFAAAAGAAGPIGALAAGGAIMGGKTAASMRRSPGSGGSGQASATQAPSQSLSRTQPLRKVNVPEKYKR